MRALAGVNLVLDLSWIGHEKKNVIKHFFSKLRGLWKFVDIFPFQASPNPTFFIRLDAVS